MIYDYDEDLVLFMNGCYKYGNYKEKFKDIDCLNKLSVIPSDSYSLFEYYIENLHNFVHYDTRNFALEFIKKEIHLRIYRIPVVYYEIFYEEFFFKLLDDPNYQINDTPEKLYSIQGFLVLILYPKYIDSIFSMKEPGNILSRPPDVVYGFLTAFFFALQSNIMKFKLNPADYINLMINDGSFQNIIDIVVAALKNGSSKENNYMKLWGDVITASPPAYPISIQFWQDVVISFPQSASPFLFLITILSTFMKIDNEKNKIQEEITLEASKKVHEIVTKFDILNKLDLIVSSDYDLMYMHQQVISTLVAMMVINLYKTDYPFEDYPHFVMICFKCFLKPVLFSCNNFVNAIRINQFLENDIKYRETPSITTDILIEYIVNSLEQDPQISNPIMQNCIYLILAIFIKEKPIERDLYTKVTNLLDVLNTRKDDLTMQKIIQSFAFMENICLFKSNGNSEISRAIIEYFYPFFVSALNSAISDDNRSIEYAKSISVFSDLFYAFVENNTQPYNHAFEFFNIIFNFNRILNIPKFSERIYNICMKISSELSKNENIAETLMNLITSMEPQLILAANCILMKKGKDLSIDLRTKIISFILSIDISEYRILSGGIISIIRTLGDCGNAEVFNYVIYMNEIKSIMPDYFGTFCSALVVIKEFDSVKFLADFLDSLTINQHSFREISISILNSFQSVIKKYQSSRIASDVEILNKGVVILAQFIIDLQSIEKKHIRDDRTRKDHHPNIPQSDVQNDGYAEMIASILLICLPEILKPTSFQSESNDLPNIFLGANAQLAEFLGNAMISKDCFEKILTFVTNSIKNEMILYKYVESTWQIIKAFFNHQNYIDSKIIIKCMDFHKFIYIHNKQIFDNIIEKESNSKHPFKRKNKYYECVENNISSSDFLKIMSEK